VRPLHDAQAAHRGAQRGNDEREILQGQRGRGAGAFHAVPHREHPDAAVREGRQDRAQAGRLPQQGRAPQGDRGPRIKRIFRRGCRKRNFAAASYFAVPGAGGPRPGSKPKKCVPADPEAFQRTRASRFMQVSVPTEGAFRRPGSFLKNS